MTEPGRQIRAQVVSLISDLGDLAGEVPSSAGSENVARVCDRLAEELAEAGAMIRALPRQPGTAPGYTFAASAALATAARKEGDFAGWLIAVLCEAAATLGASSALAAGGSCWEAAHILGAAQDRAGQNDGPQHRDGAR